MKNYEKNQYAGNLNKWDDSKHETLSVHSMSEAHAEELNKQFNATGVKYEPTNVLPHEFKKGEKQAVNTNEKDAEKPAEKPKRIRKPKAAKTT